MPAPKKARVPTKAQAKLLARMWCAQIGSQADLTCDVKGRGGKNPYNHPTTLAVIKYGWVVPTGVVRAFGDGGERAYYVLCNKGIDALEDYLRHARYKRTGAL